MSSRLKDVLVLIEQFEAAFDTFRQSLKTNNDEILQNLASTWKKLKTEQVELNDLENLIREQNSELTELKSKLDEINRKFEIPQQKNNELSSKITELKTELEKVADDAKQPKLELENLNSKLRTINEKLALKEAENTTLEQKKIENENKEAELKANFSEEKTAELEKKLEQIKQNSYFTAFLIEHSDEEIPEVDIISTVMTQGSCNLDELKGMLDVPPIMAVRTIKQLALKNIITFDEETNIVSMK